MNLYTKFGICGSLRTFKLRYVILDMASGFSKHIQVIRFTADMREGGWATNEQINLLWGLEFLFNIILVYLPSHSPVGDGKRPKILYYEHEINYPYVSVWNSREWILENILNKQRETWGYSECE